MKWAIPKIYENINKNNNVIVAIDVYTYTIYAVIDVIDLCYSKNCI